jgi:nicotinamide-nucleotide amidase
MGQDLADAIGEHISEPGLRLAVAESLTGGQLASRLASLPAASEWLAGAVVAYLSDVKFDVLGVEPGPVVTEAAALQMARGVAGLMGADVALAVTGVGGPDPEEGKPAGTVWIGMCGPEGSQARFLQLDGDPPTILESACDEALLFLEGYLRAGDDGG